MVLFNIIHMDRPIMLKFIPIFLILFAPWTFASDRQWVNSDYANLQSEKQHSAETITNLSKGTELTVLISKTKWSQVLTSNGEVGWIRNNCLSPSPPDLITPELTKNDAEEFLLGELPESTIDVHASSTERSIRGEKKPEPETYEKESKKASIETKFYDKEPEIFNPAQN